MSERVTFEKLDRLLAQFSPVRQADSFLMTEAVRDKLADAVKPMLVAKVESPGFRYAGIDIVSYPAGTIVINKRTGERATIEDNTVIAVNRSECVVVTPRAALRSD
jgi:hypothetical protein